MQHRLGCLMRTQPPRLALLPLLCGLLALAMPLRAADKPNLLFLLSDDHSYPYLGCYGNKDVRNAIREASQ